MGGKPARPGFRQRRAGEVSPLSVGPQSDNWPPWSPFPVGHYLESQPTDSLLL